MKKLGLSEKEERFINNAFNASRNIIILYDRLILLEQNEQKDTKEYKKYIDYLATMLDIENEIYSNQQVKINQFQKFCIALEELMPFEPVECEFEYITSQEFSSIASMRVFYRLVHKNEQDPAVYEMLYENNNSRTPKEYKDAVDFNTLIINDYMKILICILEKCINDRGLSSIRNELIKIKYYLSFIYEPLEKEMFKKSFNFQKCSLLSKEIIKDPISALTKETICKNSVETEVNNILSIENSELSDKSKLVELVLRKCSIKSMFSLMKSETFKIMSNSILNYLQNLEISINSISISSIIESIKTNQIDRKVIVPYNNPQK